MSSMIRKFCTTCSREQWHNLPGKKEGAPRCVGCAQPYGTGPKADRHKAAHELAKRGMRF